LLAASRAAAYSLCSQKSTTIVLQTAKPAAAPSAARVLKLLLCDPSPSVTKFASGLGSGGLDWWICIHLLRREVTLTPEQLPSTWHDCQAAQCRPVVKLRVQVQLQHVRNGHVDVSVTLRCSSSMCEGNHGAVGLRKQAAVVVGGGGPHVLCKLLQLNTGRKV